VSSAGEGVACGEGGEAGDSGVGGTCFDVTASTSAACERASRFAFARHHRASDFLASMRVQSFMISSSRLNSTYSRARGDSKASSGIMNKDKVA
jgi:hypothetical protein